MSIVFSHSTNPHKYSNEAKELAYSLIQSERPVFIKELQSAQRAGLLLFQGLDFNNDDRIYDLICSSICESTFIKDSKHYVWKALESKAESVYYYMYEKEW